MKLGELILNKRKSRNISCEQLANSVSMSKSSISDIENCKTDNPTFKNLIKIMYVLNISYKELSEAIGIEFISKLINKYDDFKDTFGETIFQARKHSGKSVDTILAKSSISKNAYYSIEKNKIKNPLLYTVLNLCISLEINFEKLIIREMINFEETSPINSKNILLSKANNFSETNTENNDKKEKPTIREPQYDKLEINIGPTIRMKRKALGIKIKELSELSNIPSSTISEIESGKTSDPKFNTVYSLCKSLDITIDSLIRENSYASVNNYKFEESSLLDFSNIFISKENFLNHNDKKEKPGISGPQYDELEINIGPMIRMKRKALGIKIKELSELSNIASSSISEIEVGKTSDPRFSTIYSLCKSLDISIDSLIRENSYGENSTKNTIPLKFTSSQDALKFLKSFENLSRNNFNNLKDEEILKFANDILKYVEVLGLHYNNN